MQIKQAACKQLQAAFVSMICYLLFAICYLLFALCSVLIAVFDPEVGIVYTHHPWVKHRV